MKDIHGKMAGVKLAPQPTNSQKIVELEKTVKNLEMAGRISQMMTQQLMQNLQTMSKDLGKAFGTLNELQYKLLAMQSVGNFDMVAMAAKADELRVKDFMDASDEADKTEGFTVAETVQADSTVIITSTAAGDAAGIFRSRIKLAESGVPALIEGLMEKTVGAKVKCVLNGAEHEVELLAIRNPPPAVEVPAETV